MGEMIDGWWVTVRADTDQFRETGQLVSPIQTSS